jgi:sn-glycerol 3-phosphate transport system permease protein
VVAIRGQRAGRPLTAQIRHVVRRPQFWFGLGVLAVWGTWYVVFLYRPIVLGLWMSFLRYELLNPAESAFVSFDHFRKVLVYERFWIAMRNTVTYTALLYAMTMPLALLASWCIVSVSRGRRFYLFIVLLPVVVSTVAISLLALMLMDPHFGALNQILRLLGLPTSTWIYGSDSALASIVAVHAWKALGFSVVLLSTAMLNVPEPLYDAAKIDGASGWQMFRKVTLPLIANSIATVSVLRVIEGLQTYVLPAILRMRASGGPGESTVVINQLIIDEAFASWRFGFASAAALMMLLFILVVTVIQMRLLQSRWQY